MSIANIAQINAFLTHLLHAGVIQDGPNLGGRHEKADHKQNRQNWLGPCPGAQ